MSAAFHDSVGRPRTWTADLARYASSSFWMYGGCQKTALTRNYWKERVDDDRKFVSRNRIVTCAPAMRCNAGIVFGGIRVSVLIRTSYWEYVLHWTVVLIKYWRHLTITFGPESYFCVFILRYFDSTHGKCRKGKSVSLRPGVGSVLTTCTKCKTGGACRISAPLWHVLSVIW